LVDKGWIVRAAVTHGFPQKLWKCKKLNPTDLNDWVYGFEGVTNRRRVYKPYKVRLELKPLTKRIVRHITETKDTQKLSYRRPDYEGELTSADSYSDSESYSD